MVRSRSHGAVLRPTAWPCLRAISERPLLRISATAARQQFAAPASKLEAAPTNSGGGPGSRRLQHPALGAGCCSLTRRSQR
jgi:hypothetical protein